MRKIYLLLIVLIVSSITAYSQTWESKASLPNNIGKHHPVTFGIGDYGYLTTGTSGTSQVTNDFLKYDPATDTWSELTDFPGTARSFAIGATYNGKAYLAFGLSQTQFLNDLWEFDPVTETWKELASCPCAGRRHPAFIIRDDRIFAGLGDGAAGNLNDWWSYDMNTNNWTQQPSLPGPVRHHPFMFTAGDHVYAGMGHGGNNIFKDWYEFDIVTNTWTQMNDFPGEARVAGTQFDMGGYGYVLSGDGDNHSFMGEGEFWKYDPFNDDWEQLTSHPGISRWAPGSFTVNNTVYFIGGQNRISNFINGDMWAYDIAPAASINYISKSENTLELYPNPTKNELNFSNLTGNFSYKIVELSGKVVSNGTLNSFYKIDVNQLSSGIYFIELVGESNELFKEKFIKQ